MKFLILIFFFLFIDYASGQQTVDKIKVNNLNLPSESASAALTIDGSKQVKASSTVSTTELGFLDGVSSSIQSQINGKQATLGFTPEDVANKSTSTSLGTSNTLYPSQNAVKSYADSNFMALTGNQSVAGTKTFTGRIAASSTTSAFLPCPVMNTTQRNALTPTTGDCVYNTSNTAVEFYTGSVWTSASANTATFTVPGVTNPKECWASYGGTGSITSPTNCTTSTCTEYYDSCSIMSATRASAGVYTLTVAAGVFTANSFIYCDISPTNASAGLFVQTGAFALATTGTGSFSVPGFVTQIAGGAATDTRFNIFCKGF